MERESFKCSEWASEGSGLPLIYSRRLGVRRMREVGKSKCSPVQRLLLPCLSKDLWDPWAAVGR